MKQAYNCLGRACGGPNIPEDICKTKKTEYPQLIRQLPTDVSYFLTLSNEFRLQAVSVGGIPTRFRGKLYCVQIGHRCCTPHSQKMTRRHIRQAAGAFDCFNDNARSVHTDLCADLFRRRRSRMHAHDRARIFSRRACRRGRPYLHREQNATREKLTRPWRVCGMTPIIIIG